MIVRRSPQAIADVDEIWFHIASDNEEAATRTITRIAEATGRLADFPSSASPRPELGDGIRSLPVGAYRVLHRVEGDHVLIVRVIHAARDIGALFDADA